MRAVNMYDNDTVKWEHNGQQYCLHVQLDDAVELSSAREGNDEIATMACWHRHYNLGDKIPDKTPEEFWNRLVRENVSAEEIISAVNNGEIKNIQLRPNAENPSRVDICEPYEGKLYAIAEDISENDIPACLHGSLSISACMKLMKPYAEWLPIWLYDHSGLSISCGERVYPYNDEWDSGCLGWIVAFKNNIIRSLCDYVLDENGERIKQFYHHENGQTTWRYKLKPLTEETWRRRAVECMKGQIQVCDDILTNNVYGFTLYRKGGDSWEEIDSVWEFYGSDITENGIIENVDGLAEAIEDGSAAFGTAHRVVSVAYAF